MYAIIKCVNGAFSIHAEGIQTIKDAKVVYHGVCQTLWNAEDVTSATVEIVDTEFNCVQNCKEFIHHEAIGD